MGILPSIQTVILLEASQRIPLGAPPGMPAEVLPRMPLSVSPGTLSRSLTEIPSRVPLEIVLGFP